MRKTELTRADALNKLKEYNKEAYHIQHAITLEGIMIYFANKLGYADEADYWAMVGLLHDIDYEMYPDEHCVKAKDILKDMGAEDDLINSIVSHGYGLTGADVEPVHEMEKILYATDELSGIINAAALMRPSKSVSDMELKSVKKKFKDKKFAAGCSRDIIRDGAEKMGWELDRLMEETLTAMKTLPDNN